MNSTFDKLHRQLGRATFSLLIVELASYGITLVCALLGLSHAVVSMGSAAASVAYVFVAVFSLFLVASVVAAIIRWFDRRNQGSGSSAH